MSSWGEVLNELKQYEGPHDKVRRSYLKDLHEVTGRNIIAYYSGWLQQKIPLQRSASSFFQIEDGDKTGFVNAIHNLEPSEGLDLVLHTPGGSIAATESLVDYLKSIFGSDIRVLIPQLAMSGGTLIALASKKILMGPQSSLGPIDPQVKGLPATGVKEEFKKAQKDIKKNNGASAYGPILSQYQPALIEECQNAIEWTKELAKKWLKTGMLKDENNKDNKISKIIKELTEQSTTKSHNRHISMDKAEDLNLNVENFDENEDLKEELLGVHFSFTHTFSGTNSSKIVENHKGEAFVQHIPEQFSQS